MPVSKNRQRMKSTQNRKNPPKKKKGNPTPWIVLAVALHLLLIGGLIVLLSVKPWVKDGVEIDYTPSCYADIKVKGYGTITVALNAEAAPITVENFVSLARSGYYDGTTFHRIMENFMAQGGAGDGTAAKIKGEFSSNGWDNPLKHTRGAISMARANDKNSANSQFFLCQTTENCTHLDGSYAVFGYITKGLRVLDKICKKANPTDNNGTIPASEEPVIVSVTIREN